MDLHLIIQIGIKRNQIMAMTVEVASYLDGFITSSGRALGPMWLVEASQGHFTFASKT